MREIHFLRNSNEFERLSEVISMGNMTKKMVLHLSTKLMNEGPCGSEESRYTGAPGTYLRKSIFFTSEYSAAEIR